MPNVQPMWVMLIPADVRSIAERVLAIYERDGDGASQWAAEAIVPSSSDYQIVLASSEERALPDFVVESLSLELSKPIYAINLFTPDEPLITVFDQGEISFDERDPFALAESLGCALPAKLP